MFTDTYTDFDGKNCPYRDDEHFLFELSGRTTINGDDCVVYTSRTVYDCLYFIVNNNI